MAIRDDLRQADLMSAEIEDLKKKLTKALDFAESLTLELEANGFQKKSDHLQSGINSIPREA